MEKTWIIPLVFIQVIFVLGLIYFFRRLMTKYVIRATGHLEELRQDYSKKEEEINKLLQETKEKTQTMLIESEKEAEKVKAKIIKEAEEAREKILNEARKQGVEIIKDAEKAREQLLLEINERISKEAINKAYELVKIALPENFKEIIHKHWLEQLILEEFTDTGNINVPLDLDEAKIISAFPLTEDVKKVLVKKLEDKLNRKLTIIEEIDSDLVAGVIITIGDFIIDGSLKNKILKKQKT